MECLQSLGKSFYFLVSSCTFLVNTVNIRSILSSPIDVTANKFSMAVDHTLHRLLRQPLDTIAGYFGEEVAFYFAFLSFYTGWLLPPALLGIVAFGFQIVDGTLDHWICIPYSIFVMVWACFMLVFWRQRSSSLAYRWGVLDFEAEETERPQFKGSAVVYDDELDEAVVVYPTWRRMVKYALSVPVLLVFMLGMLLAMFKFFRSQDALIASYNRGGSLVYISDSSMLVSPTSSTEQSSLKFSFSNLQDSNFWAVMLLYPTLYGLLLAVAAAVFNSVATALNNFENHRTHSEYMNRLILKIFCFRFVTVFTSLYYYAFFRGNSSDPYVRIAVMTFTLMTISQWGDKFLDIVIPVVLHRIQTFRIQFNIVQTRQRLFRMKLSNDRRTEAIHLLQESLDAKNAQLRAATGASSDDAREILQKEITEVVEKLGTYLSDATNSREAVERHVNYHADAKSKCWEEASMSSHSSLVDYTTLVVQLGLVLSFSMVFPLAPLLALLYNLALMRLDAYKLCYTRQRPIAVKRSGIGVWEDVVQIMSVFGVLTNCAIMGITSSQLRDNLSHFGLAGVIIILFVLEHCILLFKYWLHTSIPKVPKSVTRAQERDRKSICRRRDNKVNRKKSAAMKSQPSRTFHEEDDDNHDLWSPDPDYQYTGYDHSRDQDRDEDCEQDDYEAALNSVPVSAADMRMPTFVSFEPCAVSLEQDANQDERGEGTTNELDDVKERPAPVCIAQTTQRSTAALPHRAIFMSPFSEADAKDDEGHSEDSAGNNLDDNEDSSSDDGSNSTDSSASDGDVEGNASAAKADPRGKLPEEMVIAVLDEDGDSEGVGRRSPRKRAASPKRLSWNWLSNQHKAGISTPTAARTPLPVLSTPAAPTLAALTLEDKLRSVETLAAKHGYAVPDYTAIRQVKTPNHKQQQQRQQQGTTPAVSVSPVPSRGILKHEQVGTSALNGAENVSANISMAASRANAAKRDKSKSPVRFAPHPSVPPSVPSANCVR